MATDFVERVLAGRGTFVPPVQSLLDVDFYKFTMGQLIFKRFGDIEVTFKLIVRDKAIPIASVIPEANLRMALEYARDLTFRRTDLYYLRGMDVYGKNLCSEGYLDFLRGFNLPQYNLEVINGAYELTFKGPWKYVSHWETIALAVISGLYYQKLMERMSAHELEILYARAKAKLYSKLEQIQAHPTIKFADFSQRRRHSFLWQKWAVGLAKDMLGPQFVGTSNTWMAFHHDLVPIGTNAHELPMVLTALANSDEEMRYAQYRVLEDWQDMYGQGLRIFLPDTYGTAQFLVGAPSWVASWRGMRQDSGDPTVEIGRYTRWLEGHGVDPQDRLGIPSDGLDVEDIVSLDRYFVSMQGPPLSFGWGTLFGNDFRDCHTGDALFRPFSMVCKVVEANGRPCVKLSDNPNKATGPAAEVDRYRRIFGTTAQRAREVRV